MRILIVDDEPVIAQTLGAIFRNNGYETVITYTADSALAAALASAPNLVLCDLDMPGRDGIALMHDWGRLLPLCPILVLTGFYGGIARVQECARTLSQPVNILTKPCPPAELLREARIMLRAG